MRRNHYRYYFPIACLLGAACGGPAADSGSLADVAQAAARQSDRVSVEQLASWLIESREDFELIDVRPAADFGKGSIGNARNLPITELVAEETLAALPADRMLVVFSNGSETAAKAEVLLRIAGFDAHLLVGGFNAWQERILNPDIPAAELDGESLQVSEQRAFACYFVGERSDTAMQRAAPPPESFAPPVIEPNEQAKPLPPAGDESC